MKAFVIGTGAAGNKGALELLKAGIVDRENILFVNSTNKDIPKDVPETSRMILSPTDSGCGKERSVAKRYTLSAIQTGKFDLAEKAGDADIVIIVTSIEGGTGSGSAPIIAKYCQQVMGKNVHIYGFAGFEEDVRGLSNTIEFFKELDDEFMIHTIQNKEFLKQAKGNKFKAEELANKELVTRVELIIGDMLLDSTQNIDTTDIFKVVNTAGYSDEGKVYVEKELLDTDDFNKVLKQMVYADKSIRTAEPKQIRLAVIMNLSPASEDAIDTSFSVLKEAYGNPYEVFVHKQYDGEREYIAFLSSGMKLPIEEVKAVYERYKEQTATVDKNRDDFFDQIGALVGESEDSRFNMNRDDMANKKTMAQNEFMAQFMSTAVNDTAASSKKGKK